MKKAVCLMFVLLVTSTTSAVFADRGFIPFDPEAKIFEPTQRALIAWNGSEQILLLSTDTHASKKTRVLEVLPLPAEPKVKKGDLKAFVRATELINRRSRQFALGKSLDARGRPAQEKPAGEVTFHKRIGPHDISVTHVKDTSGFVAWVTTYLEKQGVEKAKVSPAFRKLVETYLNDGFKWFVFDIVELSAEVKTLTPIQYRFKTDQLFYPLRITRLAQGRTRIELVVMTTRLLAYFPGLPAERVKLLHPPFRITRDEMSTIDKDIARLFTDEDRPYLRLWQCEGVLSEFHADLIARERAPTVARP